MANTKSALKRSRQSITRTARNRAAKSRLKSARKAVAEAIAKGDVAAAQAKARVVVSIADKAAKNGVIHKNAASRIQSGLATALAGK